MQTVSQRTTKSVNDISGQYDRRWRSFELGNGKDPFPNLHAESLERARAFAGNMSGSRVLDIGAGMGDDALAFALSGADVTALDQAPSSNRIIRERAEAASLADRLHPVRMDAQQLGFRAESFDLVFVNSVLMHVERKQLFAEIQRVLKPGGRVIFHEPMDRHPAVLAYRKFFSEFQPLKPNYLNMREIEKPSHPFRLVRARGFFLGSLGLMPLCSRLPRTHRLRRLYAKTVALESGMLEMVPRLKQFCWILVAEWQKDASAGGSR